MDPRKAALVEERFDAEWLTKRNKVLERLEAGKCAGAVQRLAEVNRWFGRTDAILESSEAPPELAGKYLEFADGLNDLVVERCSVDRVRLAEAKVAKRMASGSGSRRPNFFARIFRG